LLVTSSLWNHHVEAFVAVVKGLGKEKTFRFTTRDVHATQTNVEVHRGEEVVDMYAGAGTRTGVVRE